MNRTLLNFFALFPEVERIVEASALSGIIVTLADGQIKPRAHASLEARTGWSLQRMIQAHCTYIYYTLRPYSPHLRLNYNVLLGVINRAQGTRPYRKDEDTSLPAYSSYLDYRAPILAPPNLEQLLLKTKLNETTRITKSQ